jgi:hypothetical protein
MLALLFLQGTDPNQAAAFQAVRDMNDALPQYIIGHAIATSIFDCIMLTVFLGIISIVRALVRRRKLKLAAA